MSSDCTPNPFNIAAGNNLYKLFWDGHSLDDAVRMTEEWLKETGGELDHEELIPIAVGKENEAKNERARLQEYSAFRLLPLGELLSAPRPTEWLIRDYLEAQSLSCLFGASGSMKTFVALDMALSCAAGLPWHGVDTPNPGPVIYIAGEGFRGLQKRIKAWLVSHNLQANAVPFFTASAGIEIRDPESMTEATTAINALASRHGNPRLVVLDTLARCFGPGDENSTSDMNGFVARLDKLRSTFKCAVHVVHHTGLTERERARGASSFRAALDMEYRLDQRDDLRILTCTKSKDFEIPADIAFTYEQIETGWADEETGAPITSIVLHKSDADISKAAKQRTLTGAKRVALEALKEACVIDGWAHVDRWRELAYKQGITASEESSAKRKAFLRSVSGLLDMDFVETEDDYYWLAGQPGHTGTCPAPVPCPDRDRPGHTPIRGVPCPAPMGPNESQNANV